MSFYNRAGVRCCNDPLCGTCGETITAGQRWEHYRNPRRWLDVVQVFTDCRGGFTGEAPLEDRVQVTDETGKQRTISATTLRRRRWLYQRSESALGY